MTAADLYARHGIASKVQAAAARETSAQARDRDEALGRAHRQLAERCEQLGGLDCAIIRESVLSAPVYRIHVVNQRTSQRMRENGADPLDALQRVLDRLAREDYDR